LDGDPLGRCAFDLDCFAPASPPSSTTLAALSILPGLILLLLSLAITAAGWKSDKKREQRK